MICTSVLAGGSAGYGGYGGGAGQQSGGGGAGGGGAGTWQASPDTTLDLPIYFIPPSMMQASSALGHYWR